VWHTGLAYKITQLNLQPSFTRTLIDFFTDSYRIIDHLTAHHLLSDCQHGFIAGRSCTTKLLSMLNDWTRLLDEREPVDALYLDFAKAFDSVPHERLLRK
jgi:hypothetical protein